MTSVSHLAAPIAADRGRMIQRCQRCRIELCEGPIDGDLVAWEPGRWVRYSGRNPIIFVTLRQSPDDPPADACQLAIDDQ